MRGSALAVAFASMLALAPQALADDHGGHGHGGGHPGGHSGGHPGGHSDGRGHPGHVHVPVPYGAPHHHGGSFAPAPHHYRHFYPGHWEAYPAPVVIIPGRLLGPSPAVVYEPQPIYNDPGYAFESIPAPAEAAEVEVVEQPTELPPPPPVYPLPPPVVRAAPVVVVASPPPARTIFTEFRFDGMGFKSGGAAGLRLLVDGEWFGLDAGANGLAFKAQPNQGGDVVGTLQLDANATFAPISGERGRLRIELGIGGYLSPCIRVAGPQAGLAGEGRLFGPVGVAGSARVVPWPYRSLDWHAAVQLALGSSVTLRGGVRQLYVDDLGLGKGHVRHIDGYFGPWLGIGVRL